MSVGATLTVPRWLSPATVMVALLGVGDAAYLTVEHFSGTSHLAGCKAGGVINCAKVTTSAESHFLGMPVALLGLIYFVLAIPFLLPAAWRTPDRRVRVFRQLCAVGGLGFVLWLVYAEFVKIHNICEYCTGVHILTLILFVLITYGTLVTAPLPGLGPDEDTHDEQADRNRRRAAKRAASV